jgi:hypothetical protein
MRVTFKQFFIGAVLLVVGIGGYLIWQRKGEATAKQARNPVQVVKTGFVE